MILILVKFVENFGLKLVLQLFVVTATRRSYRAGEKKWRSIDSYPSVLCMPETSLLYASIEHWTFTIVTKGAHHNRSPHTFWMNHCFPIDCFFYFLLKHFEIHLNSIQWRNLEYCGWLCLLLMIYADDRLCVTTGQLSAIDIKYNNNKKHNASFDVSERFHHKQTFRNMSWKPKNPDLNTVLR